MTMMMLVIWFRMMTMTMAMTTMMTMTMTLQLLCSMSGAGSRALWEDVTRSTPLSVAGVGHHHHDHHDHDHYHYDHHHHHHHHLASLTNQKSHDCQLRLCPIHHSHFNHRCNDHYHNKISSKPWSKYSWSGLRPVHHSGLRSILASSHSLGNFKREDTGDIMIVTALIIVMTVITRASCCIF